jgi:hypothetical protein
MQHSAKQEEVRICSWVLRGTWRAWNWHIDAGRRCYVWPAVPTHKQAGNANGFGKVAYFGFDLAFIVRELRLFGGEFFNQVEKLVVSSFGECSRNGGRKNSDR